MERSDLEKLLGREIKPGEVISDEAELHKVLKSMVTPPYVMHSAWDLYGIHQVAILDLGEEPEGKTVGKDWMPSRQGYETLSLEIYEKEVKDTEQGGVIVGQLTFGRPEQIQHIVELQQIDGIQVLMFASDKSFPTVRYIQHEIHNRRA